MVYSSSPISSRLRRGIGKRMKDEALEAILGEEESKIVNSSQYPWVNVLHSITLEWLTEIRKTNALLEFQNRMLAELIQGNEVSKICFECKQCFHYMERVCEHLE